MDAGDVYRAGDRTYRHIYVDTDVLDYLNYACREEVASLPSFDYELLESVLIEADVDFVERNAVMCRVADKMTYREIADKYGVTAPTALSWVKESIKKVEKYVQSQT